MGAVKIAAGPWGHQPGQTAVVGVSPATASTLNETIRNAPVKIYE